MPLPTPESLAAGVAQLERDLAVFEAGLVASQFTASSTPPNVITAVATGDVALASLVIQPDDLAGTDAKVLARGVLQVCAQALSQANADTAGTSAARAAGYTLPGVPGLGAPPPTDGGFDVQVGAIAAAAPAIRQFVRQQFFEGTSGVARAFVDGALELRFLEYALPLPEAAPALAAATVAAINIALDKAKNLFEATVPPVIDEVTGGVSPPRLADARPKALLVIENAATLRASDTLLRSRLVSLGFDVELRKAGNSASADANGRTLIVISESIQADDVNTKFTNAAVPMLICEPTTFRDLKMTGGVWQTDKGDVFDQDKLQITAGHPLAAGLSGLTTVTASKTKFIWGKPASAAVKVAAIAGQSNKWGIFGYDTGDAMVGMNAPARRVGFFLGRDTPAVLNANGWALFDAAVRWATAARALLTVKSEPLGAGDLEVKRRLERTHGLEVLVRLEGDGKTSDLGDLRVHVISESVSSTNVAARYLNSPAPTVVCEANLFDDMKLTGTVANTDLGEVDPQSELEIVAPEHPLAARLTGTVTVVSAGQKFGWGKPGAEAAKVARLTGAGAADRWGVFGYEGGANMVGTRAPAPRVGFFASAGAPAVFTPPGWALFDAAVVWARTPRVLLVVGQLPLRADDAAIKKRLEDSFGFLVDVKLATAAVEQHANRKAVVIIAESVASGDVGTKFTSVAVPVVVCEHLLFDDLKLTGTNSSTDFGSVAGQTQLEIVKADHPLAAGLPAGAATVASSPSNFAWGKPASAAIKVARLIGRPDGWGMFGYEKGAAMVGGTAAPARRVGCFIGNGTAATLNENGLRLFDAAVLWAAGRVEVRAGGTGLPGIILGTVPTVTPPPAPPPATTWAIGVPYDIGDEVVHLGIDYRCRQAHTSQAGWEPPNTYNLWARIKTGEAWTLQVMYDTGDEVTYQGARYRCLQAHQAQPDWAPPNVPNVWQRL
jgi:DNA-binding protein YbaB